MNKYTVITSNICPPIPYRGNDWTAYLDGTEDQESACMGFGPTEAEAVADLFQQLADLAE